MKVLILAYTVNIITSILKNKLFKLKSEVIDNDTYMNILIP